MSNMSYCRFENTSADLEDCLDAIQNGQFIDLSRYEKSGLRNLLETCEEILEYKEEIEDEIYKVNE
jgi:hypothetical protein